MMSNRLIEEHLRYLCRNRGLGLLACLFFSLSPVLAEDIWKSLLDGTTPPGIAPGAPAGSYALSGFETVNLYNGNLNFALPLLEVSGRGEARYTMMLPIEHRWDIKIQERYGHSPIYYLQSAESHAHQVGYGPGILISRVGRERSFCGDGTPITTNTLTRLTFVGPGGTEYELRDVKSDGAPQPWRTCSDPNPIPFNREREFVTSDGTTMTFIAEANVMDQDLESPSLTVGSGVLKFRDGTRYSIANGRVVKIIDRNGNRLDFEYHPVYEKAVVKITDSLGREINIQYGDPGPPIQDIITFKGFNGATRTIKIAYRSLSTLLRDGGSLPKINNLFPELTNPGVNPDPGDQYNDFALVSEVKLPNSDPGQTDPAYRTYHFRYNPYGELARVTLPTGGMFEYDHGSGTTGTGGVWGDSMVYRRVKERRTYNNSVLEGKITYNAPTTTPFLPHVVTVRHRDPVGIILAVDKHAFHGTPLNAVAVGPVGYSSWKEGKEYQTEFLNGAETAVLRKEVHTWAQRGAGHASTIPLDAAKPNDQRIIQTDVTLDGSLTSKVTFEYSLNAFNNKTHTYKYDFGGTVLKRHTQTDYKIDSNYTGASVHLRSLPERVTTYNGGVNSVTEYTYDVPSAALQNASSIIGHESAWNTSYTTRGNIVKQARWLNTTSEWLSTTREYDIAGNVVKETDPRGHSTTISYIDSFMDSSRNTYAFPTQATNALNQTISNVYDYYTGQRFKFIDVNGQATFLDYTDDLDRLKQVIFPVGSTTYNYDDQPNLSKSTATQTLNSCGRPLIISEIFYDSLGRKNKTRLQENATSTYTFQKYDARGRLFQVSNPYRPPTTEATACYTTTTYDAIGRPTQVETCDGATVGTLYQANETTVTDQASRTRKTIVDGLGRITQIVENSSGLNGESSHTTTYTYDPMDNLTGVSQGSQTRTFAYDSVKRLTSATNPESGTTAYDYDKNGNLVKRTDARGAIMCYGILAGSTCTSEPLIGYDKLNRPLLKNYSDSTPSVTYVYDTNVTIPSHTEPNYPVGKLTSVTSGSVQNLYRFDRMGRPASSMQIIDGENYVFGYSHNDAGGLLSLTYPSGRVVSYCHDAAARISSVSSGTSVFASGIQYTAHGAIEQSNLSNGTLRETWGYNSRLQPNLTQLVKTVDPTKDLLKLQYFYCPSEGQACAQNNGNMLRQRISHAVLPGESTSINIANDYTYDALNRLKTLTEGAASETNPYDQYGNRWISASAGLAISSLTPQDAAWFSDGNNRMTSVGYDAAGNQTQFNPFTLSYDAENRVSGVSSTSNGSATYAYDGEGRRVKKVVNGTVATLFVYDALGKLAAEYTNGTLDEPGTRYLTTDHLGSTRVATDTTGTVLRRHDYRPFGEPLPTGLNGRSAKYADLKNTLRFTGKERDAETGLDYFGARYMSSAQGRFASPDAAGPDLTNPQTFNKYRYALNNPLRYVDPNGLYEEDVHRDLTVALAMAAGISAPVATRIGGGDQGVDDNPATSPMGMSPFGDAVQVREDFHFTSAARKNELYSAFERSGRPEDLGIFFHAQQDSYSHAGFGARFGHLSAGHAPDKTYTDPAKADRMALDTFTLLGNAKGRLGEAHRGLDYKTISPFIQAFNRARTTQEKQRALQQIRNLAQRNLEAQRQREADRRRTGACSAEFSKCSNQR
jgi:RHS repeat-associated protein